MAEVLPNSDHQQLSQKINYFNIPILYQSAESLMNLPQFRFKLPHEDNVISLKRPNWLNAPQTTGTIDDNDHHQLISTANNSFCNAGSVANAAKTIFCVNRPIPFLLVLSSSKNECAFAQILVNNNVKDDGEYANADGAEYNAYGTNVLWEFQHKAYISIPLFLNETETTALNINVKNKLEATVTIRANPRVLDRIFGNSGDDTKFALIQISANEYRLAVCKQAKTVIEIKRNIVPVRQPTGDFRDYNDFDERHMEQHPYNICNITRPAVEPPLQAAATPNTGRMYASVNLPHCYNLKSNDETMNSGASIVRSSTSKQAPDWPHFEPLRQTVRYKYTALPKVKQHQHSLLAARLTSKADRCCAKNYIRYAQRVQQPLANTTPITNRSNAIYARTPSCSSNLIGMDNNLSRTAHTNKSKNSSMQTTEIYVPKATEYFRPYENQSAHFMPTFIENRSETISYPRVQSTECDFMNISRIPPTHIVNGGRLDSMRTNRMDGHIPNIMRPKAMPPPPSFYKYHQHQQLQRHAFHRQHNQKQTDDAYRNYTTFAGHTIAERSHNYDEYLIQLHQMQDTNNNNNIFRHRQYSLNGDATNNR